MALAKPRLIVVTGPECAGKSTLSEALAQALNEPWVPEYAVQYLNQNPGAYHSDDLIAIALGQLQGIEKAMPHAEKYLISDTGVEVIDIWHRDKIGPLPTELIPMRKEWKPDLYLLCQPDIPYKPHPLREDEHRRDELFVLYQEMLQHEPVQIISGPLPQRIRTALRSIEQL